VAYIYNYEHPLKRRIELQFELPTSVYGAMLAIWHLRPATQRRFPLHRGRTRDWIRFLAWCATDGRKDYAILREIPEWDEELSRPLNLPELQNDRWAGVFSVAMFFSGLATYRWSLSALLKTNRARHRVARAFWRGRRHELGLSYLPNWQINILKKKFQSSDQLLSIIRISKQDEGLADSALIEKYGLQDLIECYSNADVLTIEQNPRPIHLSESVGISPLPIPLTLIRKIAPILQFFKSNPVESDRALVTSKISRDNYSQTISNFPFGINLFGYANGELGIGEDVRLVAQALETQTIPFCIINFKPGDNISQSDHSADRWLVSQPSYAINLFCMTGIEQTRYVCENGAQHVEGRYNIGLWPWELPDWPESCRYTYACIDEVWGISQYTANAHRFADPQPVVPMTLPTEITPFEKQPRKNFGLPEKTYLYYFAFDINSNATRKNPEGVIQAFQKAFPKGTVPDVGLVLKISHPETGCKLWDKIRGIASSDKRIHIIERTMRRAELLALFDCCDCLLSLHRAEGFGRCLAEALLLGKQIITTGFSGNVDFCHEPRVALVRYEMIDLRPSDYMWGNGQKWANPDLNHAAELMKSIHASARNIENQRFEFLPEIVGKKYSDRLHEIWNNLKKIRGNALTAHSLS
jgi:hypothetical protein